MSDDPHDPYREPTPRKKEPGRVAFPMMLAIVAMMTLLAALGVIVYGLGP